MRAAVAMALAGTLSVGPCLLPAAAQTAKPARDNPAQVARGRYLVKLGGCNDCHTEGFAESNARTPERDWLEGSRLGWHGPWGTTYAVNLRLLVGGLTEAKWLDLMHTMRPKPPMPGWALQWMTPQDQRAVYAFIRHLGPAGKAAPADLPPGVAPPPPVVSFPLPPAATKSSG